MSTNSSSSPPTPAATFDPSYAVRFSAPSSTALTVTVFLLVLLFIGFFSIIARRFFSGLLSATEAAHHRRPPLLLSSDRYYRRYLTPTVGSEGLDARAVRALPVLTYSGGAKEVGGCVVCLGEFEEKERVKVIPGCGHVFHPDCIDGWLVLHGSCPICRCSHLFGAGAGNAGEVWVNLGGGGPQEDSSSSSTGEEIEDGGGHQESSCSCSTGEESEDGGAREDRSPEEIKLVGLGRSESFECRGGGGGGGGGGERCTTFLRRTCSF